MVTVSQGFRKDRTNKFCSNSSRWRRVSFSSLEVNVVFNVSGFGYVDVMVGPV